VEITSVTFKIDTLKWSILSYKNADWWLTYQHWDLMFQNNPHQPGFIPGYVTTLAEKSFVFGVQAPKQKFQGWLWGKIHLCPSHVGIMLQEVDLVDTSNMNLRRSPDRSLIQTGTPQLLCPRRDWWCQGISPSILGSVHFSQYELLSVVALPSPYKSWSYTHEGWNEYLLLAWSFM